MFFTLSKTPDTRLPHNIKAQDWILSFDDGWEVSSTYIYKGYNLENHGNYTKIWFENNIIIEHDTLRSYPLWWDKENKTLTNLLGSGESIWADKKVSLDSQDIFTTNQDIVGSIDSPILTSDVVADFIIDNLTNKLQSLLVSNRLPKKLFVTGGVDTVLLYALIKNQNIDCEIIDYEHIEYNWFLDRNFKSIQNKHWGYTQIHHWNTPCMLLTGSCGDEFFMRGPNTLAIWCAWHELDIETLFEAGPSYHKEYFLLPKNKNIFDECYSRRYQLQQEYSTYLELKKQILNINCNDHQFWHLGNTLTWTPYKDIEITKKILQLSKEDLIDQIKNAALNKKIIEKLWPNAIQLLSKNKNINSRENLHLLYSGVV